MQREFVTPQGEEGIIRRKCSYMPPPEKIKGKKLKVKGDSYAA